jgi:hypothetical protein
MDIFDQDSYVIVFEHMNYPEQTGERRERGRHGQPCKIIEQAKDRLLFDAEVGLIFTVEFSDGETIHAFAEELIIDQTYPFS